MDVKLKDPTKVYYCKEQKVSFAGDKNITCKVTQHVRQLLNEGALVEVTDVEITEEQKAAIVAEAKKEEEAKAEADRVAALTPAQKAAETKAKKEAAEKAAKKTEKA